MATIPYMQLYVSDYIADTQHLTTEEHGAYILLLMNQWHTEKPIPKNRLARITRLSNERWTSVERTLSEFFNIDQETGLWSHPRVEKELERVYQQSVKNAKAGRKSAEIRKAQAIEKAKKMNERSTNVSTKAQPKVNHKDKDKDKDNRYIKTLSQKRFAPPSLDELKSYIDEKGLISVDPEYFIDFYESKGWMVGKNKMKDWKATARGWHSRNKGKGTDDGKIKGSGKSKSERANDAFNRATADAFES